jgi:hypothetical protein
MKLSKITNNVLHNKYVLYFVLFLSMANILGYMVLGKLTPVLFFVIVAYLIYNFSKNMIIVLGSALLLTNVLMVGNAVKEGFEASNDKKEDKKDDKNIATIDDKDKDKDKDRSKTPVTDPLSSIKTLMEKDESNDSKKTESTSTPEPKKDEGMTNKRQSKLDYAATVENAYGDLNNLLGGDGIKRLTQDTQTLMTQQVQLADAMKSMSPLMENAKSLLQGFDMKHLNELAGMAKSFTSSTV